jgi:hypothetical protein
VGDVGDEDDAGGVGVDGGEVAGPQLHLRAAASAPQSAGHERRRSADLVLRDLDRVRRVKVVATDLPVLQDPQNLSPSAVAA